MRAFLSYQTNDKVVAGTVAKFLDEIGLVPFLAHEDIEVSQEWRDRIMTELDHTDLFVAFLSKQYLASSYCLQESGVAAIRKLTVVPLSIDGTTSPGFLSHIQSKHFDPSKPKFEIVFAGIAKRDSTYALDRMIEYLGRSKDFRTAEYRFALLLPHLDLANDGQKVSILRAALANGQIAHAGLCARAYLPPLMATHGDRLSDAERAELSEILQRYAKPPP